MQPIAAEFEPLTAATDLPPLERDFFSRPTDVVARALLGQLLVSEGPAGACVGRIVETEAYGGPDDRASHARAGRTRRTAPMFGPVGHAYVYLVYGLHWCLNVVARGDAAAGAVLLRALEPLAGIDAMRERRGRPGDPAHTLAAGPARLAQALGVDGSLDGHDLTSRRRLWLASPVSDVAHPDLAIANGPRVGVGYAGPEWSAVAWRFWLDGHPSVSR